MKPINITIRGLKKQNNKLKGSACHALSYMQPVLHLFSMMCFKSEAEKKKHLLASFPTWMPVTQSDCRMSSHLHEAKTTIII